MTQVFKDLVADANLPKGCEVKATKTYKSNRYDAYLNKHKLRNSAKYRAY